MTPNTLFVLILCNIIWSAHPLMGKVLLAHHSPLHVAWLRYGSAWIGALFIILGMRWFHKREVTRFWLSTQKPLDWMGVILLGLLAFFLSALLQTKGLSETQATDNALIIAMEPLMATFFAWVFLKESLHPKLIFSFLMALAGFFLLSGIQSLTWGESLSQTHVIGNLLILASLLGESSYSVLGKWFTRTHAPVPIFFCALTSGFFALTVTTGVTEGFPTLASLEPSAWLALFWLGPLGTTAAYLVWLIALRQASVGALSITLFIQPLVGAFLGFFYLQETLSLLQLWGGLLILLGVSLPLIRIKK